MSEVSIINNIDDYKRFKKKNERAIIFYGAKWCESCTQIYPLYVRIFKRYSLRLSFAYCDIDVAGLDFTTVPVLVTFWKGEEIDNMEGSNIIEMKKLIRD